MFHIHRRTAVTWRGIPIWQHTWASSVLRRPAVTWRGIPTGWSFGNVSQTNTWFEYALTDTEMHYTSFEHPRWVILSVIQNDSIFGRIDLQDLAKVAPRFANWHGYRHDVGRVWLFSHDHSMLLTKGINRHLQPCSAIVLHFMCLSELRNRHWSQTRRRLGCRKTMVVLAVSRLMWSSNLERKRPMINKFSNIRICTVFH